MTNDGTEDTKKMVEEHNSIINSVGLVTRVWATLEMSLFQLFSVLAGMSRDKVWDECAGVIFYTPSNTETRIALVDNLVTYRCELKRVAQNPIDQQLVTLWNSVKGKINTLKNTRNMIVHGTISSAGNAKGTFTKLTPAFGDTLRFLTPLMESPPRIPGLGSNELRVHEQAVWRVNSRLHGLTEAFRLRMQLLTTPDQPDVIKKLLDLLPQLSAQTNTQNSPDPVPQDKNDPDQSSSV